MVISKIKRLAATREKLARLEKLIATDLPKELVSLPEKYGFATAKEFIAAVKSAAGRRKPGRRGRKPGRPKKTAVPKARKRAVITDAIRAKVQKLVKAGKPGSQIAKTAGISLPSVQNIKKALGLVKSRGSKANKAPAKKKPAQERFPRKASAKKAPAAPQLPTLTAATGE